ncbi:hypothetical protein [Mycobacterium sp. NAZ190054]|uniref:hypothetical protein n=1 Tax=Mycobacterium sp. NAZ190054 TaxID=1747766 RepID=UPI0007968DDC|nr:hypothetical protein [Mycobacterium sp. NAZ190054]KWX66763.1 hypothetical protein ASJ79_24190 [Mycobacterium sp. NAZ190054]
MADDPLYSAGTSALLVALTALRRATGVPAAAAFEEAHAAWQKHRGASDSWELSALRRLVAELGDER